MNTRDVGRVAPSSETEPLRLALSVLSAGAAAIHFAVTGEHLREYWLFGAFFAATGGLQALWAILVMIRPSSVVYLAGAIGNLAIVVTWGLSRTVGLPIGPDAGVPESAGVVDVAATACEALIGVGVLALLQPGAIRGQLRRMVGAVLAFTALAILLGAASLAASGGHH